MSETVQHPSGTEPTVRPLSPEELEQFTALLTKLSPGGEYEIRARKRERQRQDAIDSLLSAGK